VVETHSPTWDHGGAATLNSQPGQEVVAYSSTDGLHMDAADVGVVWVPAAGPLSDEAGVPGSAGEQRL
jgi:hypothetical protein